MSSSPRGAPCLPRFDCTTRHRISGDASSTCNIEYRIFLLQPCNILLGADGHIKLADMGGVAEFADGTCLDITTTSQVRCSNVNRLSHRYGYCSIGGTLNHWPRSDRLSPISTVEQCCVVINIGDCSVSIRSETYILSNQRGRRKYDMSDALDFPLR